MALLRAARTARGSFDVDVVDFVGAHCLPLLAVICGGGLPAMMRCNKSYTQDAQDSREEQCTRYTDALYNTTR